MRSNRKRSNHKSSNFSSSEPNSFEPVTERVKTKKTVEIKQSVRASFNYRKI